MKLCPIYLALPEANIVALKFIIESYEGLAELRTLNAAKGEVVLLALSDTEADVRGLIQSLGSDLSMREIPIPESLANDWLLGEFIEEVS